MKQKKNGSFYIETGSVNKAELILIDVYIKLYNLENFKLQYAFNALGCKEENNGKKEHSKTCFCKKL